MSPHDIQLTPAARQRRRRRRVIVAGAAAVVVLGAGGAGIWWFLRDDAPAAVSLESATESITGGSSGTGSGSGPGTGSGSGDDAPGADAGDQAGAAGVAGTWAVDTSIGDFSFEDSSGTFVGFRVEEELSGIGSTTAVGRTPAVSGTITIDGTTLTEATIEADMGEITTNDRRRDDKVSDALDTGDFPTATFVLTTPVELGADAAAGGPVQASASGDLTIHGVTREVTFALEAQLVGDTIVVVGSLEISFGDYGVSVPTAPIVLSAEDHGIVELQLLLTRT